VSFKDTYKELFKAEPPCTVRYEESNADIISEGRGFMSAFDYTMQLKVGCEGSCRYCYVAAKFGFTPKEVRGPEGKNWGFLIRRKKDIEKKLTKHLNKRTLAGQCLYWSGVTDPYTNPPRTTRNVWEILLQTPLELRPRRIALQTRYRPDRDAKLIAEYCKDTVPSDGGPAVVVSYSIGTDRNDIIRAWERATPSFEQRLKAITTLRQNGIFVVVTLSPFAPWNDLLGSLKRFQDLGVAYITVLFFKENTHGACTPKVFLQYLREVFPYLLDESWQSDRVEEIKGVYGENRVLVGQKGFESLAKPQDVIHATQQKEKLT